jgi:hypothetical protein
VFLDDSLGVVSAALLRLYLYLGRILEVISLISYLELLTTYHESNVSLFSPFLTQKNIWITLMARLDEAKLHLSEA